MPDLAIVIVNYNTREQLRDCLRSVFGSEGHFTYEVYVVDNASTDGSTCMVRAEFPQVHLIESPVNGGYAYANNLALRAAGFKDIASGIENSAPLPASPSASQFSATPRFALLLNPDTVLPPTALAAMLAFMDTHPEAGIAGPKLLLADGSLDLACRRGFPTVAVSFYRMIGLSRLFPDSPRFGRYNMTFLDPDQVAEVDSVVGAFMLIRREAILATGLLDEQFFMYGEDLDWALRIKQAGWKVYYNPAVTVLHYKRVASRHSRKAKVEFYRAMALFHRKHYAAQSPFWHNWLVYGGIALWGGVALVRDLSRPRPAAGNGGSTAIPSSPISDKGLP